MAIDLPLLESLLLLFVSMNAVVALAQDNGSFVCNGFQRANLRLGGTAVIHPTGLLQLTNTSKQIIGRAFYPIPLEFNKSSSAEYSRSLSFSTTFVFAMVRGATNVSGHGIAFAFSPSLEFSGAVASQYLGLFNLPTNNGNSSNNQVFAIELDTILSPEFSDIDDNHVGIDVNSPRSIKAAPAAYYWSEEGKNKSLVLVSGDPIQVWIEYDGVKQQLNVTLAPLANPKPDLPLLSTSIDLSSVFVDSMYVGFSSSTGAVASSHYILGWSFSRNGQAQRLELSRLPSLPILRESKAKQRLLKIGLPLMTVAALLIATMGGIYIIRRKKYAEVREDWEQEYGPHRFSYKDLYRATKGFRDKELLGVGGSGRVYRGVLPAASNTQIAVKRITHDSKQGMKGFVAEIASMGRLRHRNLVQLLGYCRRKGELILVYDYMSNGSLDKFLFTNERPNLSWFQRYKIIRDVASGLLYLHEEWEQVVLHRDVKAGNVLLDEDMNGRLGDFGLARLYDHGANPQTTHVVGTLGYLAPELTRTGKATTITDVFAFGALMLEVACGRRPVEMRALPEEMILVDWVTESWKKGAILETRDPRLGDDYVVEEMELVLKLGLLCSHPLPTCRPTMRQILQYLDGVATLPNVSPFDVCSTAVVASASEQRFGHYVVSYPTILIGKTPVQTLSRIDSILIDGR
ncbi:PREDICTED: L-type lectin-domain containing receptor kinase IV.1-like [Nelumbo nucifera]|uniref:non-specific serine/threonine protein kinase n=2 Tax=Nelumbo nucifera TaxID=4432 RepID=A0A1U8A7M1_NELNU|nr:PREDICTED: L-type lectin-domain containing receptor kinase IV.1-like [Nelumbo nucifera]DAD28259.1 TPA_asm: hypothetical protein HUJ06_029727 [Nelumbo nucifera]